MAWTPTTLTPLQLRAVLLHYQGYAGRDIALVLGRGEPWVSLVINSGPAQDVLAKMADRTIDTMLEVQAVAQAAAMPALAEKIRLMTEARDERVRSMNAKEILDIAGHMPVRRVSIERSDGELDRLHKMSDDELQAQVRAAVNEGKPGTPTVH